MMWVFFCSIWFLNQNNCLLSASPLFCVTVHQKGLRHENPFSVAVVHLTGIIAMFTAECIRLPLHICGVRKCFFNGSLYVFLGDYSRLFWLSSWSQFTKLQYGAAIYTLTFGDCVDILLVGFVTNIQLLHVIPSAKYYVSLITSKQNMHFIQYFLFLFER